MTHLPGTSDSRLMPRLFLLVLLSIGAWQSSWGAVPHQVAINDPIFTLDFDSRQVHFESLTTNELMPNCKRALSDINPLPSKLTLYAKYETSSRRIYIAGPPGNIGLFVASSAGCDAGIPILALLQRIHEPTFPGDTPRLTGTEVSTVFHDALVRYAAAFGGKKQFLQWLETSSNEAVDGCNPDHAVCNSTYRSFPPALLDTLEEFKNN